LVGVERLTAGGEQAVACGRSHQTSSSRRGNWSDGTDCNEVMWARPKGMWAHPKSALELWPSYRPVVGVDHHAPGSFRSNRRLTPLVFSLPSPASDPPSGHRAHTTPWQGRSAAWKGIFQDWSRRRCSHPCWAGVERRSSWKLNWPHLLPVRNPLDCSAESLLCCERSSPNLPCWDVYIYSNPAIHPYN
jgi:hypothetical protein